jgi:hypothetical protein
MFRSCCVSFRVQLLMIAAHWNARQEAADNDDEDNNNSNEEEDANANGSANRDTNRDRPANNDDEE